MNSAALDGQALAIFSAAIIGALALLYLLKPRRRQVEVPFGGLWRRVIEKAEARVISNRWRRIWSLLLNWMIAALMLAALGEVTFAMRGCAAQPEVVRRHTVVIVDTSASMASTDGVDVQSGRTATGLRRIDEALERARQVIASALPEERFLLVTADSRVRVWSGWTPQLEVLAPFLAKIDARDAGFDEKAVMQAANDALVGRANAKIVLISDGGRVLHKAPSDHKASVQHIMVGPALPAKRAAQSNGVDNLAVERVSARRLPADPEHGVLLVHVRNDGPAPVRALVTIASSAEAQTAQDFQDHAALKGSKFVELRAREARTVVFEHVDMSSGRFAAMIRPNEGAKQRDIARYDDIGFAVLADRRSLNVLLVSDGNLFLEAALHANERINVKRIDVAAYHPDRYAAVGRHKHGIDLVVLEQANAPPPEGMAALVFGLRDGALPQAQILEAVDLVTRAPHHPVMEGVSFVDVNVDRARVLGTGTGDKVLAADRGGSAVIVARDRGVRRVWAAFNLLDSDIGGRFTLPLFVGNAVLWLMGEDNALVPSLEVGQVWGIETPVTARKWVWRAPGGKPTPARVAGHMITCSSVLSGVHLWRSAELTLVRPTRLPASERPGERTRQTPKWHQPPSSAQRRNQPPPRRLWADLLLAAMVALAIEWVLYVRRRTV